MPLDFSDRQRLHAASGYIELGMYEDANAELEKIDAFCRAVPEVLALRVAIYQSLGKWELLQVVSQKLVEFEPTNVDWIISYAYATRRAESIEAARAILTEAKKRFPREAVIVFNLACYECQLGHLDAAKDHLKRAFAIDSAWRPAALDDIDLEPIWQTL